MPDDRVPAFATLAVHAGRQRTVAPAAVDASGLPLPLHAVADLPFRAESPSIAALEERIAALDGGSAAVSFASANAALIAVFHVLMRPGDEFLAARQIGEGSKRLFTDAFPRFGWTVRWADIDDPASFASGVSPRTKAIFFESIGETGAVADFAALAEVAKRARVPLISDNSLATAYLCQPLAHGADVVLYTRAGLVAGRGEIAGALAVDGGSFDWSEEGRYPFLSEPLPEHGIVACDVFGNAAFAIACRMAAAQGLGAPMAGADLAAIETGIETLALRVQRQSDNARSVAAWLSGQERVRAVSHPGLPADRYHNLARKYCPNGAGPTVGFSLKGGDEAAETMLGRLRLVRCESSPGATRSFILRAERQRPGALVLYAGIEDRNDIVADLEDAFAAL